MIPRERTPEGYEGLELRERAYRFRNRINNEDLCSQLTLQALHAGHGHGHQGIHDAENNVEGEAIGNGADFARLISMRPEEVICALKGRALIKLGEFSVKDSLVLGAFGHSRIITRGHDKIIDVDYASTWQDIIDKLSRKSRCSATNGGWDHQVKLSAYCVSIKDAAAHTSKGILQPVLRKVARGSANNEVWTFPTVQAVIEHKWSQWAKRYITIQFIFYMGWVLSFLGFLAIYIQEDIEKDYDDDDRIGFGMLKTLAYMCDSSAFILMLPFLILELRSICYYKLQWFQMWNLFDFAAYVFQIFITVSHMTGRMFPEKPYNTILAIHCTVLFVKVQYFSRVMGVGAAYVETLRTLLYHVRYFLMFIVLTMISAAFSFAVLYREDIRRKDANDDNVNESLENFATLPKSLVTTYTVLLGSFEPSYVFETDNRVVKGIFFLLFQLLMSITVLNLLIAVMTEGYSMITEGQEESFIEGRAQIIEELEVTLPRTLLPKMEPYVHFIKVATDDPDESEDNVVNSGESLSHEAEKRLKSELSEIKSMIKALQDQVSTLQSKNEAASKSNSLEYALPRV